MLKIRDREEIKNGLDVHLVLCRIISVKSDRTCSRRCQLPNTSDMLCIVLLAPHRLSRTIQCSQQLWSHLVILCWKNWNCLCCWRSLWSACRWGWFSIFWIKFRTLTPCDRFTAECGTPECWSQCSPRWLHDWTRRPRQIMQCHDFLQEQIVLSLCVHSSCFAQQIALFHREHA